MADYFASYHFPRNFQWGTATAAHQVEGGNRLNTWSRWEEEPGRILNGDRAGLACDWWSGRWKEDFDRAAETGQNAHRLSIEWSRIQPAPDLWDEDALEHYRSMLRGLVSRNLAPMVTLHHFTDPAWLGEMGGWEHPQAPALFEAFVRRVVPALKEYCSTWVTVNEPNVYAVCGYVYGVFPPGVRNQVQRALKVMVALTEGHARAYHAIHELQRDARVGIAQNYRSFHPRHPGSPLDNLAVSFQRQVYNDSIPQSIRTGRFRTALLRRALPQAAGTQDFLGINYYTRDLVSFSPLASGTEWMRNTLPPGAELSPTGFIANVPDGLYEALKWGLQFKVPLLVTENGVEDAADLLRPRYTLQHIHKMWRAVNFNWPVRGYYHWSLVDNFEWERGWSQRFGLWGLDTRTQARTRNRSVDAYAAVCRENGITTAIVEQYAPEVLKQVFPA